MPPGAPAPAAVASGTLGLLRSPLPIYFLLCPGYRWRDRSGKLLVLVGWLCGEEAGRAGRGRSLSSAEQVERLPWHGARSLSPPSWPGPPGQAHRLAARLRWSSQSTGSSSSLASAITPTSPESEMNPHFWGRVSGLLGFCSAFWLRNAPLSRDRKDLPQDKIKGQASSLHSFYRGKSVKNIKLVVRGPPGGVSLWWAQL